MIFYCGWDGGGSKTEVLCADESGREIVRETFGPLNMNGLAWFQAQKTIADAVDFMASVTGNLEDCCALTIGSAGVSNAFAKESLISYVRERGYRGRLQVVGDHEIALEGAINGPGAVLISGTGSVCCGRDAAGNHVRTGGFGYLIDDVGSGYAIGREILSAVVRAFDGRGPKTILTNAVFEKLGLNDIPGLIKWLYSAGTKKTDIASLAELLTAAVDSGDETARNIADRAAQELSELAVAAWKKLGLSEGELALTGSILKYQTYIRKETERLCGEACPGMCVINPRRDACTGAVRLAMRMQAIRHCAGKKDVLY